MNFRFVFILSVLFLPIRTVDAQRLRSGSPVATSAVLNVSANPVLLGHPVILTAVMQPTGVTGSVTFYSGVTALGVSPISGGQATFETWMLPAGINQLTARFQANVSYGSSLSAPVTVNVGVLPGTGFPGGIPNTVGMTPAAVVLVDLNNDGITDLVSANSGDGTVSSLLGNGDGTFQTMQTTTVGTNPAWVVVADFNGDGKQDLAVVNSGDPSVEILLGNGNGTFQALTPLGMGSNPVAAAVGDFNGDGTADIVVVDANNGTVTILLGSGDGNFTVGTPIGIGMNPLQVAVADFNGDGKTDLAIAGSTPDGVAILLGGGDGTFALQPLLSAGVGPSSIVTADFNGDGKADLAVGDYGDFVSLNGGGIMIFTGNGDGSFQSPIQAAAGPNVQMMAVADFDGDGTTDIGIISGDGFSTYAGNGDGTLQSQQPYSAGLSPVALAAGSFDATGLTEVAVLNRNENLIDVLPGNMGTCTYAPSAAAAPYDAAGATGGITLTTNATGCPWSITSDAWIVPQSSAGMGGGPITFQILPNSTGFDRGGALNVGGQTSAVSQRFTTAQFTDVPSSGYNFDAVNLLKNRNITAGCGATTFCPNTQITRAQMAVFIVRGVYGGDNFTSSPTPYFADVPADGFGFRWIQKLYELGITAGCGGANYCPNNVVTRNQMSVFIIRARFGSTASFYFPSTPYFTDVPTGAFAFAWIQRMRLDGITSGCGINLYCPENPVVRGDMAIFIMRGLFNALYPAGTPALISVSPTTLVRGQPGTFTVTGSSTNFVQGQTTVTTALHVTATNIQVSSPTMLTVDLSADSSAVVQPVGLVAITGAEQAVLPNGVTIQ